jgi:transcriptional regulator with XRE-family HTH domain
LAILLGKTAREFRELLGLTQRAAADMLDISCVHLCNIENNRAAPSQALIEKYRELWGIDLYVLAWCTAGEVEKLPKPLRRPAAELAKGWKQHVEQVVERHRHRMRD